MKISLLALMFAVPAQAQSPTPTPGAGMGMPSRAQLPGDSLSPTLGTGRQVPGDTIVPHVDIRDPKLREQVQAAAQKFQALLSASSVRAEATSVPVAEPAKGNPREGSVSEVARATKRAQKSVSMAKASPASQPLPVAPLMPQERPLEMPPQYDLANGVRVFARNVQESQGRDTVTLPSGSIALATVLYGVQVTPDSNDRVLPVELDYAWLGPNEAVVEMKHCRAWVPVKADMNIERILGAAYSITCRAPNGAVFEIPVRAHMVNKDDEYLGAQGTLVLPGKAKAAALLFLQNGVEAFGKAMAAAQVSQSSVAGQVGSAIKSENVSGDQKKYIVGSVLEQSTSKFLDWFIDYYASLSPQLAIGPGHKIYLAVEGSVEVPRMFFGERVSAGSLREAVAATESQKSNTGTLLSRVADEEETTK